MNYNLIEVEKTLLVVEERTNIAVYDFNFELHFQCTHPYSQFCTTTAILRIGAIDDYREVEAFYRDYGLTLVNSYEQHLLASELPNWYSYIQKYTPKSQWYSTFPEFEEIEAAFGLPFFLKGSRQTSRHNPALSIIETAEQYEQVKTAYTQDPILHWQDIVVREYVRLRPVVGHMPGKVPCKYEFRTFWYGGTCVGFGPYWYQIPPYPIEDREKEKALTIAGEVASCVNVPFLVIDLAQTEDGEWIVIECNDAQESGYAGIPPKVLWDNVLKETIAEELP